MKRHCWRDVGLVGLYFYSRCNHCKMVRREKSGRCGPRAFEYSVDGTAFVLGAKVPACARPLSVVDGDG